MVAVKSPEQVIDPQLLLVYPAIEPLPPCIKVEGSEDSTNNFYDCSDFMCKQTPSVASTLYIHMYICVHVFEWFCDYLARAMSLSRVRASSNWRCRSDDFNHSFCHL